MTKKLSMQEIILILQKFWSQNGVNLMQAYDNEVGAGTQSPYTFLRANGPEPWSAAYVQPSRRPTDGRYGKNPNRLFQHHQFQVIIKPSPDNIQNLYLDSLKALSINPLEHDILFVEDNWENPSMGAAGIGWEVWLDGMEISQFTYFQKIGSIEVDSVSSEITYGLERLASFIQNVDSVFKLEWGNGVNYEDIFKEPEYEYSVYSFEQANKKMLFDIFNEYEKEANHLLKLKLVHPAYDYILKMSHTFNLLDARGAISVIERAEYLHRIRTLAHLAAKEFIKIRKKLKYPLIKNTLKRDKNINVKRGKD